MEENILKDAAEESGKDGAAEQKPRSFAEQMTNEKLPEGGRAVPAKRFASGFKSYRPSVKAFDLSQTVYIDAKDRYTERKSLRQQALDNLYAGMDSSMQTVFKGTVTGLRTWTSGKQKKLAATVNTNAGVEGFAGKEVMIPYEDFVIPSGSQSVDVDPKLYISKRIGSETEFIVKEMLEDRYILASRRAASEKRIRKFWMGKKEGTFLLRAGSVLEVRIVYTTAVGVICEAFGMEFFIPARELAYYTITNCNEVFSQGQVIRCRITSIAREDQGILATLSHKATFEDSRIEFLKDVAINDLRSGIVKRVLFNQDIKRTQVFVHVDGKYDALCSLSSGIEKRPCAGERALFRVMGLTLPPESEEPRVWGEIYHIDYYS